MRQFTSISVPRIWSGDELGMWGADDPVWSGMHFETETHTNYHPGPPGLIAYNAVHHRFY